MDPKLRIVRQLPLQELWDDAGMIAASRTRSLSSQQLKRLLQAGPVQFVVADVGLKLRWIALDECYQFWKSDVQLRLPSEDSIPNVDVFPVGYCYFASEWQRSPVDHPIVALTKVH